jgi:lipoic acid synthetase
MHVPNWIRDKVVALRSSGAKQTTDMKLMLRGLSLHTVCEEAKCPNLNECFGRGTATFLIMGDICTRNCTFCAVKKGEPTPIDPEEPKRIALTVKKLGLRHSVVTSVTRDDLEDGGASHFAATALEIKKYNNNITVELLIPDFQGNSASIKKIADAAPDVINHNIETVSRLYKYVRPRADYNRSLNILRLAKELSHNSITKSGFMVGLGETNEEIVSVTKDLRAVRVDILTIGQYLRPSGKHYPVVRYVTPEEFRSYEEIGYNLGFSYVVAGPFVRSSYKAEEALKGSMNRAPTFFSNCRNGLSSLL